MRHHHDRDPALVELLKNPHDFDARAAVEIAGRLVSQDDLRIVDQSAGDGDALLLSAGELAGMMIFAAGKADGGEHFPGFLAQLRVR